MTSTIGTIGSEIEIYRTPFEGPCVPGGHVMVDLNPGKLGGGKRLGAFACFHPQAGELEKRVENIARAYTWDVKNDCYVVFDMQLGIQEIDGTSYISPLIFKVKKAIEEKGYRVKGFIGRDKQFSEYPDNWMRVEVDDKLQVKSVSFDQRALDDLAQTEAVYFGCHFAPPSCRKNQWDEDTCRNGLINNFLDLPAISWLLTRSQECSVYHNRGSQFDGAFLYSKDESFRPDSRVSRELEIVISKVIPNEQEPQGITMSQRLKKMKKLGHRFAAVKKISKISIGGRGVSFIDLNNINLDNIPSPSLVAPYYPIEPTETSEGKVIIQTRIIYSWDGREAKPEFVFAKMYPVNGMAPEPYNLSSLCTDFVVWDMESSCYYLNSPSKGRLSCKRGSRTENKRLTWHFESAVDTCLPQIALAERTLHAEGGHDYYELLEFYRSMEKAKLVPSSIRAFLNPFIKR